MEKHEWLRQEDHYECKTVYKGRMDKWCEHCGGLIPKGTRHDVHTFHPEFNAYPTHVLDPNTNDNLPEEKESCSQLFIKSLN